MQSRQDYEIIKLKYDLDIPLKVLYLVAIMTEDGFVMVDTGYPGSLEIIEEALNKKNLTLKDCRGIVITHNDYDHMGSLYEILEKYSEIKVYSSAEQKAYIEGTEVSPRLIQVRNTLPTLPIEEQESGRVLERLFSSLKMSKVDYAVAEGNHFPWGGGATIVETPGHLPGHISVYLDKHKTLIAGDTLVAGHKGLKIPEVESNTSMKELMATLKKLRNMPLDSVICTHGGLYKGEIQKEIDGLIHRYE